MNVKIYSAPPNTNNYTEFIPDIVIYRNILEQFEKNNWNPDIVLVETEYASIILLNTIDDETGLKTGYITEKQQVKLILRWYTIINEVKSSFLSSREITSYLSVEVVEKYLRNMKIEIPKWQVYWIASLQNELINLYVNNTSSKQVEAIRFELLSLYK